MPSSRGSSQPRNQTHIPYILQEDWQADSLPLVPPGKHMKQIDMTNATDGACKVFND